jgi:hypothetical protein
MLGKLSRKKPPQQGREEAYTREGRYCWEYRNGEVVA